MAVFLLSAAPARAAGQGWTVEPRLGGAAAGTLYEDPGTGGYDEVAVTAATALELGLAVRTSLDESWMLDVEVHYSPGSLRADGVDGERRISDLAVYGGAVLVRRSLGRVEAAAGAGAVKYEAADARAWEEGSSFQPAARLGVAVPFLLAGRRMRAEATARVHRHQTPVLEAAGADAATVVRAGAHVAIEIGGSR